MTIALLTKLHLTFRALQALKQVIGALIPGFLTMRNTMSESLPTNDCICMILFIALSSVLHAYPPNSWRLLGKIGAGCTSVTYIALVAICMTKAGGGGP